MIQIRVSLLATALCAAAFGHADVAFDSFGPGNTYDPNAGYTIGTSTSSFGYQSGAMQFTSLATGSLLSVTVPVRRSSGSGELKVGFYADNGNDVGAELASWMITVSGQSVNTLAAPAGISIVTGARYWVGLIAQGTSSLAWNNTQPSVSGRYAVNFDTQDGTVSGQQSTFRVETQPVPEPASMPALGLGAAALLRRRKRA